MAPPVMKLRFRIIIPKICQTRINKMDLWWACYSCIPWSKRRCYTETYLLTRWSCFAACTRPPMNTSWVSSGSSKNTSLCGTKSHHGFAELCRVIFGGVKTLWDTWACEKDDLKNARKNQQWWYKWGKVWKNYGTSLLFGLKGNGEYDEWEMGSWFWPDMAKD